MVITWKNRNIRSFFPLKQKMITNCVLSSKEIVFVVHVTLVKPNLMRKLDRMNIIIQLQVQNHQKTFEATLATILHGLSFQMLQKMLRPQRTQKHHVLLCGNLILTNKSFLKNQFYLEMVSHRAINDIIQTPKKKVHFFYFLVCCIVFSRS